MSKKELLTLLNNLGSLSKAKLIDYLVEERPDLSPHNYNGYSKMDLITTIVDYAWF